MDKVGRKPEGVSLNAAKSVDMFVCLFDSIQRTTSKTG